jgi:hypothetical protein
MEQLIIATYTESKKPPVGRVPCLFKVYARSRVLNEGTVYVVCAFLCRSEILKHNTEFVVISAFEGTVADFIEERCGVRENA